MATLRNKYHERCGIPNGRGQMVWAEPDETVDVDDEIADATPEDSLYWVRVDGGDLGKNFVAAVEPESGIVENPAPDPIVDEPAAPVE